MEQADSRALAQALNRLLKQFADVGWISSSAITAGGRIHIDYSQRGFEQMATLKRILIDELNVALKFNEFQALMALLLRLDPEERA
jgi:hypothetical protein